ncbi:MAG: hypothetical protein HZB92_04895 [Euryarchaeota archaeon]|nr:hypothetical protein [Euryarchaeota archaeon]
MDDASESSVQNTGRASLAARLMLVSLAGAVIISFLYVTVQLKAVASLYINDTMIAIGPIVCGFFVGLLLSEHEVPIMVLASTLVTIFSSVFVAVALFAPPIWGVAEALPAYYYDVFGKVALSVILTYSLTLVGSVLGKIAGDAIMPSADKMERDRLRAETLEWYRMLETVEGDKLKSKGAPKPGEGEDAPQLEKGESKR